MKQRLLLTTALLLSISIFAQEKKEEKGLKFYGFIRNAIFTDTYRGLDAVADQFYLFPLYTGQDDNGEDYNEEFQSNMTAIASRLGLTYSGPEIFGAQSSAKMEFDFGGITGANPVLFRIRQAYFKLNWDKSSLTAGQTWHPFWNDGCFPHVGSLNTGAPFVAFNRSPQLRYDYNIGQNITLLGAAVYENQYTSKGFYAVANDIDKTMPLRYSGTPELVAMAKIKTGAFTAGVGAEYKTILPIDRVTMNGKTIKTDHTNSSYGLTAFANYKKDKLYILVNTIVGQNLTHFTQIGGYGVKSVDASTGEYEYTNYTNYTAFANITYGKKWQGGLFLGYGGNLGTSDALAGNVSYTNSKGVAVTQERTAGLLQNIQTVSRIAPSISLNVKGFRFTTEYEMTSADYGTGAITLEDGLYNTTHTATNHRMLFMMMYFF